MTNLPIIDSKKKMICIDGGMTIKKACQMNLFIIDKCGENYSHRIIWDTDMPKKTVLKDFSCDMKPVYARVLFLTVKYIFLMKSLMYISFCHRFLLSEKVSGYRSLTKMKQCLW